MRYKTETTSTTITPQPSLHKLLMHQYTPTRTRARASTNTHIRRGDGGRRCVCRSFVGGQQSVDRGSGACSEDTDCRPGEVRMSIQWLIANFSLFPMSLYCQCLSLSLLYNPINMHKPILSMPAGFCVTAFPCCHGSATRSCMRVWIYHECQLGSLPSTTALPHTPTPSASQMW